MTDALKTKKIFSVYIVLTKDGRYYTGYTNDLERRMKEHSKGIGSKFMRCFGFERLLYTETFEDRTEAMRREIAIKKLPRDKKEELIRARED